MSSSLYDPKNGLSNIDLHNYFNKHNIPFHEIDSLEKVPENKKNQAIVYTGAQKDAANNGVTKHWLHMTPLKKDKKIFDSYGDPRAYNSNFLKDNNLNFINRKRLQEFNTNTCGEYCALWAKHLNEHPNINSTSDSELVNQFIQKHHLTKNHLQNDENVKKYYEETK